MPDDDYIGRLLSLSDSDTVEELIEDIQGETATLDQPDTGDLYTKKPRVPEETDDDNPTMSINGVRCHPLFARIARMMGDGLSPVIKICGKEQTGKSSAACVLSDKLHNMNLLRGPFRPQEQVIYSVTKYLLFERSNTRRIKVFEEDNETLNKNQYNTTFNHAVAGSLRTQAKRQNPQLFVGPEVQELDPRIVDKIDVLIDLKSQQYAHVTLYEYKHGKKSSRGLDYEFKELPAWHVPDVDSDVFEEYDSVDDEFKGGYLDELLLDVLQEKLEEKKERETARL